MVPVTLELSNKRVGSAVLTSLSSGFVIVRASGVREAVLLRVAFPAFTSYTRSKSLRTTFYSKKCPLGLFVAFVV